MPKSNPPSPHVKAKKSLGQNFLQDRTYLDKIVAAAELSARTILSSRSARARVY